MNGLTDNQREIYSLYLELKSERKVAEALGKSRSAVNQALYQIKAKFGAIPHDVHESAPIGHTSGKRTVQLDAEGNLIQEWVRLHPEANALESVAAGLAEGLRGKHPDIKPAKATNDRCVVFPVADPHIGLYCWGEETGDDYDLATGVALHLAAFRMLLMTMCPAERVVLAFLGDMVHSDSRRAVTELSGHHLDTDDRYQKVVRETAKMMREMVVLAAKKAKQVDVFVVQGNHDWHTASCLSLLMEAYFENVKHVHVDDTPCKQKYFVHGTCLRGLAHGDTEKPQRLKDAMTEHESWSACKDRAWYTGHIHQRRVEEFNNCIVESFSTLAGKDSYASAHLYQSRRQMVGISLDPRLGEIDRRTINLKALKEAK